MVYGEKGKVFNNEEELMEAITEAANKIPKSELLNLCDSMPKRLMKLYLNHGRHIDY